MDRRDFLKAAAAGTAAMSIPRCIGRSTEKPNVVFVFDDQLRQDVCGVYGGKHITTPNIDKLAGQGMTFDNAISTCPICTPFRGMVHTGRYPTHSGILLNMVEASYKQNPRCLGNVFRDAGYDTGFIGKWHLSAGWRREEPLMRPNRDAVKAYRRKNPETEFVPPGPGRLGYQHWEAYNFHESFNDYWYYEDEPVKLRSDMYETDTQIDQALRFMEKRKEWGRPFLLTIAPHPPHPPFLPRSLPAGYLERIPENIRWAPNVPEVNPRTLREMRIYLAMVKNMDENLGRLMTYLDDSSLSENTIVVFTSDHGDMHGSHGLLHKMYPYAESVNVPLLVRWPGRIRPGTRSDTLFTPMDHLPTLCGLSGLRAPGEVDGVDLSDVLLRNEGDSREGVLMGNYNSPQLAGFLTTSKKKPEWRGVKTKQYTYCKWLTGDEELYDDLEDPFQMNNLAVGKRESPTLRNMRGRLKDLLHAAHDEFLPGPAYADWFDDRRNLVRSGLGPVHATS